MHEALWISEICSEICDLCDKSSLARLSYTCSNFTEPALDALYATESSFWRMVVQCFPDLFDIRRNSRGRIHHFSILRYVSPEERARFTYYARRIKAFHHKFDGGTAFLDFVGLYEQFVLPETLAFPRLKQVHIEDWRDVPDFWTRHCGALLSSELRRISFRVPRSCPPALLSELATLAPHINEIDIMGCGADDQLMKALSTSLATWAKWANLRRVTVESLTAAAFKNLALSSSLQHLTITSLQEMPQLRPGSVTFKNLTYLRIISTTDLSFAYPRGLHFPALTQLITSGSVPFCLELLRAAMDSPLEIFSAILTANSAPGYVPDFASLLSTKPALRNIHIDNQSLMSPPGPVQDFDSIRALLRLRNLAVLELQLNPGFTIWEEDIHMMATSWPSIRRLRLQYPSIPDTRYPATLSSLFSFLPCRQLEGLELPLDASIVPYYPQDPSNNFSKLTLLSVGCSNIEEPENIAKFLLNYCPTLQYLNVPQNISEIVDKRWKTVTDILQKTRLLCSSIYCAF